MGTLYVAANFIEATGRVDLGYGHLQIVYGGTGSLQEIEVQSPLGEYLNELGFFAYPPVQDHLDPDNTTGTVDPDRYQIVELEVGDRNPDLVWGLL